MQILNRQVAPLVYDSGATIGEMLAVHKQLQNALTKARDDHDRERLRKAFPALRSCTHPHFLAIRRYLDSKPERFFEKTSCEAHLTWLLGRRHSHGQLLKDYLSKMSHETNNALLFLREINTEWWHDRPPNTPSDSEYEEIRFIDRHIHPTYLRLVEAVLGPLSRPVAYFSRLDRSKNTNGLDLWSVMEELKRGNTKYYTRYYRPVVRNGIAHGGVSFIQDKVRYMDKKGNMENVDRRSVMRLCDNLIDICNGLALALKIFFLVSREQGYSPPRELLVEELYAETLAPWWRIEGCLESQSMRGSQLVIYACPNSRHYEKIQWSAFQSGILSEFFAPGYARYFISLRSHQAWPGWASFDGNRLRALRESNAEDLSHYHDVCEEGVFYVCKPQLPRLIGSIDTLVQSIRINVPLAVRHIKQNLNIQSVVCRNARIHRNSWGAVLNAEVVLEGIEDEKDAMDIVRRIRHQIVRSAIRLARKGSRFPTCAHLPIGFAQVAVFRRNHRRRHLSGFGLGSDLICTVRLQRLRGISAPDLLGSNVEQIGKWRIAWNKAWLEELDGQQS